MVNFQVIAIIMGVASLTSCLGYSPKALLPSENGQMIDGKREGIWKHYRDIYWHSNEPENADYYEYVYLENNKMISNIYMAGNFRVFNIETPQNEQLDTIPIALNGTYKFYDKNAIKRAKFVYQAGQKVHVTFYFSNGNVLSTEDFKNKYNDIPFTSYFISYNKDGSIKHKGYWRKYGNSWAVVLE